MDTKFSVQKFGGRPIELTITTASQPTLADVLHHPSTGALVGQSGRGILDVQSFSDLGEVLVNSVNSDPSALIRDGDFIRLISKMAAGS